VFVSVLFAVALAVAAAVAWRGDRRAAVLLAVASVIWLLLDKAFEGPVLFHVTPGRGLVLADVVGGAGLLGAATAWRRSRR
jgi:hypothetical protein